ncbi:MAG: hypothetical protein HY318_00250 [Armatimonadetes bacterium]|nr:hypothetical protein [Armatimonadota bacterium]
MRLSCLLLLAWVLSTGAACAQEADPGSPIARTRAGIIARLTTDLRAAREAVNSSGLSSEAKKALNLRLDTAEKQILNIPTPNPDTFKTIFPLRCARLDYTHAQILSVYGPIMRSRGLPAFFAWKKHRYDYMSPHEVPEAAPEPPSLSIEMLSNEFRADAFLLTNASETAMYATLRIQGIPGSPRPKWLRVAVVPWTDTTSRQRYGSSLPVASALPEAEYFRDRFRAVLPAGMTTKVWLTVDSVFLKSGDYRGSVLVEGAGKSIRLPFRVRVSSIKMERPRLSLGMWDLESQYLPVNRYSEIELGADPNSDFRKLLRSGIDIMKSHFLDSPWANLEALPWPEADAFDADGKLKNPLDFTALNEWVALWPDARNYLVFANVAHRRQLGGAQMGTPEFNSRVGAWATAIAKRARLLGLKPKQLALCLVDEPDTDEQSDILIAWTRAIKSVTSEIAIFTDARWRPETGKWEEAIPLADIVCPTADAYQFGEPEGRSYWAERRGAGQKLRFYNCGDPIRVYDPYLYYRLMGWLAFREGAVGIGWWSFYDMRGAPTSWNEYPANSAPYCPAFRGTTDYTDSIHWQAVREGIEDYEYMAMLRDAAARVKDAGLKARAEALIAQATSAVLADGGVEYRYWNQKSGLTSAETDHTLADKYRLKALALLEMMHSGRR